MDLDLIEKLLRLLEQSSVNELEVSENGVRIRVAKTPRPAAPAPTPASQSTITASSGGAPPAAASASTKAEDNEHVIVAGLVGTFYRAPAPGAAPYITEGEMIEEGQTLALVEAMKMLNPVEADCAGRVKQILVDDAMPVVAGAPLIIIEKAG